MADVLALDIGGANIKAADGLGWCHSESFPLWRRPETLPDALGRILRMPRPGRTGTHRRVVATMTGEIADCFASRRDGVAHIVGSLVAALRGHAPAVAPEIYLVDGRIVSAEEALRVPLSAAASNWHAVARLAAAHATADRALLIDVGSTTTDIVPLRDGGPTPLAGDDAGRMETGELVYTGVERTPVATLVRSLPWRSARRPVAAECFAESRDVWLLLGGLPEDTAVRDTADGMPATRAAARVRLARMLLIEPDQFTDADAATAAEWCATVQARRVAAAIARVVARAGWRPTSVVLSGHGDCLARRGCQRLGWSPAFIPLPERLGRDVSRVAPAHALALIARGALP